MDKEKILNKKNDNKAIDDLAKPKTKPLKFVLLFIGLVVVCVLAWIGIGTYTAISKVVTDNKGGSAPSLTFSGNIEADKLNGEGDGRINILLIGFGGKNHPGGLLADTIMVASVDPQNKKIAFLSIPRDLYVQTPDTKNWGKINSVHSYGEQNEGTTGGGPALMKKTVSEILDLPIHYYVRADFDGFVKLVDALDGVTVDVKKNLYDPYYPAADMVGYSPFSIKAGTQNLDGKTALKFARSRETTSDFDRAGRQQQIMVAVKEKAMSVGVLTNPKKITDILAIVGDHVRTDIQTNEMQKLLTILKDIDTTNIVSKVIDNSADGPLVSKDMGGYYLVPKLGIGKYTDLRRIAHEIFSDPYLSKENARVQVLNATGVAGSAKEVQDTLKSYGYNVVSIDKNPEVADTTTIIDYASNKFPYTIEFLKKRFNASVKNEAKSTEGIDLTVILGKDYLK